LKKKLTWSNLEEEDDELENKGKLTWSRLKDEEEESKEEEVEPETSSDTKKKKKRISFSETVQEIPPPGEI
jgi:hypothetical protein